jgi:1-acyl-sn-glycerol-3-phosphate acyltransferase
LVTFIRSCLYFVWFLVVSVAMHILALPTLLMPRKTVVRAAKCWSALLVWGLKIFAGLRYEVRGTPPGNGVLVAAKHMSMWDTLALYMLLDDPIVVIKRELQKVPLYGWFATKADMIFVDRKGHASALRKMAAHAAKAIGTGRSLIIFPEGSRRKPGAEPAYKSGIAGLYGQLRVPCVPVALNSGLFWTGRGGFLKKRGCIVVAFLPPIPTGLTRAEFMRALEESIETATGKLVQEGRRLLRETEPA